MKKYLVLPGLVRSKNDNEAHWIPGYKLIALYGVKKSECIIYNPKTCINTEGLIELRPRRDGDYRLPSA